MRGAPAIAIVGCLSLAVELKKTSFSSKEELSKFIEEKLNYLVTSRPTAVNMGKAAKKFIQKSESLTTYSKFTLQDMLKR